MINANRVEQGLGALQLQHLGLYTERFAFKYNLHFMEGFICYLNFYLTVVGRLADIRVLSNTHFYRLILLYFVGLI